MARKGGRQRALTAQRKKEKFLEAYSRLGNQTAAAEATGISRYVHLRWMQKSEQYRKAFDEADELATQVLEQEAIRRAVKGNEEPVYFNGQQVGSVTKYSDTLLIFLLKSKRPEVYRERYDARLTANLNVQSAVKVIHEYHDQPPAIEAQYYQDQQPNKALMSASVATEPTVGHASTSTGTPMLYRTVAEADAELPTPPCTHLPCTETNLPCTEKSADRPGPASVSPAVPQDPEPDPSSEQ